MTHRFLSPFVLLLAFQGCSAEPARDMEMQRVCTQDACQLRLASQSGSCSRCLDLCLGVDGCDPSVSCAFSCMPPRACTDAERSECIQEGFEAVLPSRSDAALESACLAWVDRVEVCGLVSWGPDDCARFARVERPEMAEAYACAAELSCAELPSGCGNSPAPGTLGHELCGAFEALCAEECNPAFREQLNADAGWFRDDVIDAVRGCTATRSCRDLTACMDAWLDAIYGS